MLICRAQLTKGSNEIGEFIRDIKKIVFVNKI